VRFLRTNAILYRDTIYFEGNTSQANYGLLALEATTAEVRRLAALLVQGSVDDLLSQTPKLSRRWEKRRAWPGRFHRLPGFPDWPVLLVLRLSGSPSVEGKSRSLTPQETRGFGMTIR
jgi:hypothetical protein